MHRRSCRCLKIAPNLILLAHDKQGLLLQNHLFSTHFVLKATEVTDNEEQISLKQKKISNCC